MTPKTNGYGLHNLAIGALLGALAYHLWMTRGGMSGPYVPR